MKNFTLSSFRQATLRAAIILGMGALLGACGASGGSSGGSSASLGQLPKSGSTAGGDTSTFVARPSQESYTIPTGTPTTTPLQLGYQRANLRFVCQHNPCDTGVYLESIDSVPGFYDLLVSIHNGKGVYHRPNAGAQGDEFYLAFSNPEINLKDRVLVFNSAIWYEGVIANYYLSSKVSFEGKAPSLTIQDDGVRVLLYGSDVKGTVVIRNQAMVFAASAQSNEVWLESTLKLQPPIQNQKYDFASQDDFKHYYAKTQWVQVGEEKGIYRDTTYLDKGDYTQEGYSSFLDVTDGVAIQVEGQANLKFGFMGYRSDFDVGPQMQGVGLLVFLAKSIKRSPEYLISGDLPKELFDKQLTSILDLSQKATINTSRGTYEALLIHPYGQKTSTINSNQLTTLATGAHHLQAFSQDDDKDAFTPSSAFDQGGFVNGVRKSTHEKPVIFSNALQLEGFQAELGKDNSGSGVIFNKGFSAQSLTVQDAKALLYGDQYSFALSLDSEQADVVMGGHLTGSIHVQNGTLTVANYNFDTGKPSPLTLLDIYKGEGVRDNMAVDLVDGNTRLLGFLPGLVVDGDVTFGQGKLKLDKSSLWVNGSLNLGNIEIDHSYLPLGPDSKVEGILTVSTKAPAMGSVTLKSTLDGTFYDNTVHQTQLSFKDKTVYVTYISLKGNKVQAASGARSVMSVPTSLSRQARRMQAVSHIKQQLSTSHDRAETWMDKMGNPHLFAVSMPSPEVEAFTLTHQTFSPFESTALNAGELLASSVGLSLQSTTAFAARGFSVRFDAPFYAGSMTGTLPLLSVQYATNRYTAALGVVPMAYMKQNFDQNTYTVKGPVVDVQFAWQLPNRLQLGVQANYAHLRTDTNTMDDAKVREALKVDADNNLDLGILLAYTFQNRIMTLGQSIEWRPVVGLHQLVLMPGEIHYTLPAGSQEDKISFKRSTIYATQLMMGVDAQVNQAFGIDGLVLHGSVAVQQGILGAKEQKITLSVPGVDSLSNERSPYSTLLKANVGVGYLWKQVRLRGSVDVIGASPGFGAGASLGIEAHF